MSSSTSQFIPLLIVLINRHHTTLHVSAGYNRAPRPVWFSVLYVTQTCMESAEESHCQTWSTFLMNRNASSCTNNINSTISTNSTKIFLNMKVTPWNMLLKWMTNPILITMGQTNFSFHYTLKGSRDMANCSNPTSMMGNGQSHWMFFSPVCVVYFVGSQVSKMIIDSLQRQGLHVAFWMAHWRTLSLSPNDNEFK